MGNSFFIDFTQLHKSFNSDEIVTESYHPFIIFTVIMTTDKLKKKIVHTKYTNFDIKYL